MTNLTVLTRVLYKDTENLLKQEEVNDFLVQLEVAVTQKY